MSINEITESSWQGILKIQDDAYTGVPPEEISVLKSKWNASPETCFVFKANNEVIVGYLLAHSWGSIVPPKLFEELPINSTGDLLYLHDLAVSSDARGLGIGRKLFSRLIQSTETLQFKCILLVAVQESYEYWSKLGFREIENVPICSSYGENARLMINELQA